MKSWSFYYCIAKCPFVLFLICYTFPVALFSSLKHIFIFTNLQSAELVSYRRRRADMLPLGFNVVIQTINFRNIINDGLSVAGTKDVRFHYIVNISKGEVLNKVLYYSSLPYERPIFFLLPYLCRQLLESIFHMTSSVNYFSLYNIKNVSIKQAFPWLNIL